MPKLTELRDDAFSASEAAHNRMRRELAIYANETYSSGNIRIGNLKPLVAASLDPKIKKGIHRLLPAFLEQMPRIEVQPDKRAYGEEDFTLVRDLRNWLDMMDEVAKEGDNLRTLTTHNLVCGNAISKVRYDAKRQVVSGEAIDPLTFAPDPKCSNADLSDADFVVQRNWHLGRDVKRRYKLPTQRNSDWERTGFCVDEMWLTKEQADDCSINVKKCRTPMVLATLINDEISRVQESPYWWPSYPFVLWRNFLNLLGDGKAHDFWGYGYGTFMWPQQKLYDELLANLVLINRNTSIGRFLTTQGTLDRERILAEHGIVIELEEGKQLTDIMHLPPEDIPVALFQFVQMLGDVMDGMMPSLSPVFIGESPSSNASGRLANTLQQAAINQISDNVTSMNESRLVRARIKLTLIQQFADRPLAPHRWRGGLDLPESFPDDARKIGYQLVMPDSTSIPNTLAGKLQLVQFIQASGFQLSPERFVELLGLDRGFGLQPEDLLMPGVPQGTPPLDEEVLSGQEMALRAER